MVFDTFWFEKYQPTFLWLLNSRFTKRWFRWVLRIRKHDAGYNRDIVRLQPNHYVAVYSDDMFIADFRTHDKYAKRLYYAFYPVWLAMHVWDLLADKALPELSFGFGTLVKWPDAAPSVTTVDGMIRRAGTNEAFNTIHDSTGTTAFGSTATTGFAALFSGTTAYNELDRSIFLFDTSQLGANSQINNAIMSLWCTSRAQNWVLNDWTIDIFTSTPASNTSLATGDYLQVGTASQTTGALLYSSVVINKYIEWDLSSTGKGNISKTGVTKFGCREATYDAPNIAPAYEASKTMEFRGNYADLAGTVNDPKLTVIYTSSNFITNKLRPRAFAPGLAR
jgi:hypothetical protein